ncbi:subtype A tannase [Streptomyces sp. NPDC101234]|uniref:subtype A tannase n=1 Tax=Streptomyces sp. NPDC101234 TaxID=3366138 RepID=UPI0038113433
MEVSRRHLLQSGAALTALGLTGCSGGSDSKTTASSGTSAAASTASVATGTPSVTFDSAKWSYDKDNDVYYRLGAYYCAKPAAKEYEYLGICVPGKYLKTTKNSDGTYTAKVNNSGRIGSYTARTAPVVMPINTGGYAPQSPLTSYSFDTVSAYLKAGFVYVAAGLRGRGSNTSTYTGNAPWGVTDLKAAVRFLRYNDDVLPGDKDSVFVFGGSGGGGQGSVAGSSGDSALYTPYLESIGAAMKDAKGKSISDAIAGVMAWVPITELSEGNLAYEWNMGQFATTDTRASGTWTEAYSKDLAEAFPAYLNKLGLRDSSGRKLTLAKSSSGTYLAGSYYDHLISVIQTSLNNFLSDTTFPYTQSSMTGGGAPGGGLSGAMPSGAPSGAMPSGAPGGAGGGAMPSGAPGGSGSSASAGTTYKTVEAYFEALNKDGTWVTYDSSTKKATVHSLSGFIKSQKTATKVVGAFDSPGRDATENGVFGIGNSGLHYSQLSQKIMAANEDSYAKLKNWKSDYAASAYTSDFKKTDSVGTKVLDRANMYNPMYYLSGVYAGYKRSKVAGHWRIRTGIMQGDTANTTEINLVLALQNYGISSIDFATVWGQGHMDAERTGSSETNFISWVKEVVPG